MSAVFHRHQQITMKARPNRSSTILADPQYIIATYTLDKDWISPLTLLDDTTRKFLPLGSVVAYNPTTGKVVPNYTSYGFGAVGVIKFDADCGNANVNYDAIVDVVWRGDVLETHCWDNGTYGEVLDATKAALCERIAFVKTTRTTTFHGGEWE